MLGRASSRIATIAVGGRASQQRIMKVAKEFPVIASEAKQSSSSHVNCGLLVAAPCNDDPSPDF
jgi:hypothetical protein